MTIAGLERFAPNPSTPADFDELWSATLDELACVAPRPRTFTERAPVPGAGLERVQFDSIEGAVISGYVMRAAGPRARPMLVHAHGYNARYDVMTRWVRLGFHVLGFDARGFGRSSAARARDPRGYVLTGIESPYTSILRGAVADYVQAAATAALLLENRIARTVLYGFSFGGALALMAAALSRDADLLVLGQPTFGWTAERIRLARGGSSAEIARYIGERPSRHATVMRTLQYFDTMSFAPRVRAPTLLGIGLDDGVVPSRTVLAMANRLACPLELRLLPVSHSADPRESLWDAFEAEWVGYARDGPPEDFGAAHRQVASIRPCAAAPAAVVN